MSKWLFGSSTSSRGSSTSLASRETAAARAPRRAPSAPGEDVTPFILEETVYPSSAAAVMREGKEDLERAKKNDGDDEDDRGRD